MGASNNITGGIGNIVTNLKSLEFALRLFLNEADNSSKNIGNAYIEFTKLTVGESVPVNYFTNYDPLNKLISKVNSLLRSRGLSEQIDESIVELRDAIAHGRVVSLSPEGPYRILKFSKPVNDKTQVTVAIDITPSWLSYQTQRTYNEILKIVKIAQSLGLKCFPGE